MGSAASVVDSHPLLPTPVISHQPCDSSVLSRGWLAGWLACGRRNGGGKEEAGTPSLGKATLRPIWRASHGRGMGMAQLTYIPILPRAQPGRPTAMTRRGCCLTAVGFGLSCPSVSSFESGLACG